MIISPFSYPKDVKDSERRHQKTTKLANDGKSGAAKAVTRCRSYKRTHRHTRPDGN